MKKMQKLCRMDLGLDVEAYKNYVNNIEMFAKVNHDFEVLGKEDLSMPPNFYEESTVHKVNDHAEEEKDFGMEA